MDTPGELRYSKSHEWVKLEGNDTARIGITDFAQSELGDVIFLELPGVGQALTTEDPFGTVESVKAVSDLVAPVSGEVLEINDALVDAPGPVNTDPYGSWMVVLKLSDPAEYADLLTAAEYDAFTAA